LSGRLAGRRGASAPLFLAAAVQTKSRNFRIALSGATGTGKTTLARALADALGLPLIAEDLVAVVEARRVFLTAARESSAGLPAARDAYLAAADAWLHDREAWRTALPGFVADRWGIDLLTALVSSGLGPAHDKRVAGWIAQCQRYARHLDLIVMPPLVRFTDEPRNEFGLPRASALGPRVVDHCLIRGLIEQFVPTPRLYLPDSVRSVEARVEHVRKVLERLPPRRVVSDVQA